MKNIKTRNKTKQMGFIVDKTQMKEKIINQKMD